MAGNDSKGGKKSTSGWAAINDNQGQSAGDTSTNESADSISSGSPMATELPDGDASGPETSGTGAAESQVADVQADGDQAPSRT